MNVELLSSIIEKTVRQVGIKTDETGAFPEASIQALKDNGFLSILSSKELGGAGGSLRDAAEVCQKLAEFCSSTAMITCMHYCAAVVVEKHGSLELKKLFAKGDHLSTLAFSESGSRSHFWAPIGTANICEKDNNQVELNANKSWVTSANHADSYIWSSKPLKGENPSSIWYLERNSAGLKVDRPFTGIGMRGNESSPVTATKVKISTDSMLGNDGEGFDIMMGVVLPTFVTLNASVSIGIMSAALNGASNHVKNTGHAHLSQNLSDLPTIRAYLAKAKILLDSSIALRDCTLDSIENGLPDTMLKVLEVKALASENALEVCDIAMRVCGGAAFRKDVGIERNFRDSRAASVMAPTTDVLYDFIGKIVCGLPLF